MLTHGFWFLTCNAGATYRLAILLTRDTITDPLREASRRRGWIRQRDGLPVEIGTRGGRTARTLYALMGCPWCVSIYLAVGVVALTRFWPAGWQYAALALALSGVAGFLAER